MTRKDRIIHVLQDGDWHQLQEVRSSIGYWDRDLQSMMGQLVERQDAGTSIQIRLKPEYLTTERLLLRWYTDNPDTATLKALALLIDNQGARL